MEISKFHTVVELPEYEWQSGYGIKNMFIGSCFTENVGNRMANLKFDVDINPFGILYNPVSVAASLQLLLENRKFTADDLIQWKEIWHSFYHHGRFSSHHQNEALDAINNRLEMSSKNLREIGFLFITFGTAWVYRYKKTGQTVSNCHKIPTKEFERFRLPVESIVDNYVQILSGLQQINPDLKVIFTVSPIRHWSDGAIENQRSKSVLLLAIDEIIKQLGEDFCAYFPAYEIVMDELRDYRYYNEDMIHLTDFTINHIWEKFSERLLNRKSREVSKRVNKFIMAKNHRPQQKGSSEYRKFIQTTLKQIDQFSVEFPYINLTLEKEYFVSEFNETDNNMR